MTNQFVLQSHFINQAFQSVIPRSNRTIYTNHFDLLVCLYLHPNIADQRIYFYLLGVGKFYFKGHITKSLANLLAKGFVTVDNGKYQVTDKALLLIAKVERKLQSILKEKGLLEVKPVGRPNRGGNMKEL